MTVDAQEDVLIGVSINSLKILLGLSLVNDLEHLFALTAKKLGPDNMRPFSNDHK